MPKIFENPQNHFQEAVGGGDVVGTLLLGPFWYLRRGVYAAAIIDLILYVLLISIIASGDDNAAGTAFF